MEREETETSRSIASLRAQFGSGAHLDSVDELVPYVDGHLDSDAKRAVEAHLANCEVCRREVSELRQFAQPPWWRRRTIAGIAAAVVIAVTVLLTHREPPARNLPHEQQPLAVSLRDGDRVIGIDDKGVFHGLTLDPETARRAASLLAHPDLAAPAALAALAGDRRALRGPVTHDTELEVVSPVGIAVVDTRPKFHWQARSNGPYQITIVDGSAFELQGETAGTNWIPPSALARGKTYDWQVATMADGRRVVAPSPPDPPARFRVVDQASADAIRNANSHLIAGMLAYEAGAMADARREFALLASTNSSSPIPMKLITSCDRARRSASPPPV